MRIPDGYVPIFGYAIKPENVRENLQINRRNLCANSPDNGRLGPVRNSQSVGKPP